MTQHTLFVCVLCGSAKTRSADELNDGQVLFDQLNAGLADCEWRENLQIQPVKCMAVCGKSCVVSWAAPDKLTFVVSQLSPDESVPEILEFSGQYVACEGGKVPYRERPSGIKKGVHAVLPPLPVAAHT